MCGFPPIFTDKTHRQLEKKSVEKSADFYGQEKSDDSFVGGEIVWWDTSLKADSHREDCERLEA